MKQRFIQFLLLFSLLFNITHASVIAMEENCKHESINQYIAEQEHQTSCGDLCDFHYLFHFIAIVDRDTISFDKRETKNSIIYQNIAYISPTIQSDIKPPIV